MFRLVIVACLAAVAFGSFLPADYTEWEGRIVGGSSAGSGQFPYQVSLRSTSNSHFCGGSMINSRWIVTAAHCTINRSPTNTLVIVSTHLMYSGGISHRAARIVNHPSYNSNSMINDVACVQTQTTMQTTNLVRAIPLGSNHLGAGVSSVASGWGQISHPGSAPNNLQYVSLQTLDHEDCRRRHASSGTSGRVHTSSICTFSRVGQGTCMGDSGGPLAAGGSLIGIVSWGIPCAKGSPDVFTRVSSHRNWILSVAV